ncbi:MAG: LCP family protein [Acidimicrobiales bacterium]
MASADDLLPRPGDTGEIPAVVRHGHRRPPKRRRWIKRSAIGLSAVIVLALLLGGAGWFYINYRLGQIPTVKHVKHLIPVKPGAPMNILLIGSDSRVGIPADEVPNYGGTSGPNAVTGQRSDVIIILRVVPATHSLEMLSIPRDTWANIPGTGTSNKINSAFNYGPSELILAIEDDFHIPINHFVYTTFPGFTNAVDDLGGVYMDFPDPVHDTVTGLNIKTTGCQLLNGVNSLALVRSRDLSYYVDGGWNYDGLGDLSRIRRQQEFFHAVIDRAQTEYNPIRLNAFIGDVVHDITVDSSFTVPDLRSLAIEYHSTPSSALHTDVLPTQGAVINGSDVLLPAWRPDEVLIHDFLAVGATPPTGSTTTTTTTTTQPSTTTTTTQPDVSGTTTPIIYDNTKDYPEPWNPVPCNG